MTDRETLAHKKAAKALAQIARADYIALLAEGFDDEAALRIVVAMFTGIAR